MATSNFMMSSGNLPTWAYFADMWNDEATIKDLRAQIVEFYVDAYGEEPDEDYIQERLEQDIYDLEEQYYRDEVDNAKDAIEKVYKEIRKDLGKELTNYLSINATFDDGVEEDDKEGIISDEVYGVIYNIEELFSIWVESGYYDGVSVGIDFDIDDFIYQLAYSYLSVDEKDFENFVNNLVNKYVNMLDKELYNNTSFNKIEVAYRFSNGETGYRWVK